MITKITGEQPFQVLTNNFSISPSNEGYTLQISADGKQYSNLFTVGAGVTRLVTGVAANSYYRLSGNDSEVSINWMKTCVTEGGGGSFDPTVLDPYWTSAQTVDYIETVVTSGVDLSNYYTKAETDSALTAVEDHLFDVERVTATALTELHDGLLELSARTGGNSNILAAISSQTEYEAISGSVKTFDMIQVYGVDINDDGEPEYGLFANVCDGGAICWERRDNENSLLYTGQDYPWMTDNSVYPYDIGTGSYFIAPTPGDDFVGFGFTESVDGFEDGTFTISKFAAVFDDQTGEITGMTREDRDILGELDTLDEVVSAALVDLNEKKVESEDIKHMVKLDQAAYDQLVLDDEVDPETFYIIVNNSL